MLFDRFSVVPSILENYSRDSVPNGLWPVYLLEWSFAILLRILPRKWPRDRDEDDSNSKADYNQENTKANNRLKFLNWESLTSRNMTPSVDNRKWKKRNDIAVWSPRRWDPNYRKGGRAAAENSVNREKIMASLHDRRPDDGQRRKSQLPSFTIEDITLEEEDQDLEEMRLCI